MTSCNFRTRIVATLCCHALFVYAQYQVFALCTNSLDPFVPSSCLTGIGSLIDWGLHMRLLPQSIHLIATILGNRSENGKGLLERWCVTGEELSKSGAVQKQPRLWDSVSTNSLAKSEKRLPDFCNSQIHCRIPKKHCFLSVCVRIMVLSQIFVASSWLSCSAVAVNAPPCVCRRSVESFQGFQHVWCATRRRRTLCRVCADGQPHLFPAACEWKGHVT